MSRTDGVGGVGGGPDRGDGPAAGDWGPAAFAWGVWGLMLLAALAFVVRYGDDIPYSDELELVPAMTGERPVSLGWIWSLHNEHRPVLTRVVLVSLYRVGGDDVRAGMFLNVGILGALAFAGIRTAKHLRGRTSYADAFFPLVLLHWGHDQAFLLGHLVQFAASTGLAGAVLLVIARAGNGLTPGPALGAGACLLLLTLVGANGVVLVPPLGLWLGYAAVFHWHPGRPRPAARLLVLGLLGAALALVGYHFLSYAPDPNYPPATLGGFVRTTLMVLSLSLGPGVMELWPLSALVVPGLLLVTALLLTRAWVRRPSDRPRVLGLLMFLVAVVGLAAAVGWGRGGRTFEAAFSTSYATLSVPVALLVYLTWVALARPEAGRFVQVCLFALACALAAPNFREGRAQGVQLFHAPRKAFERDMLAGVPLSVLTEHHPLEWNDREGLASRLRMLKRAGVGAFGRLQDDPPARELSLPVSPSPRGQMVWRDGLGYGSGGDSYLAFALDRPRPVYAIRLRYSYPNNPSASCRVSWGQGGPDDFRESGSASLLLPVPPYPGEKEGDEHAVTFWVNGTIGAFRVYPDDKPYVFKLSGVTLLVPAGE